MRWIPRYRCFIRISSGCATAFSNWRQARSSMKLYLVRHAIAAERGIQYPDDSKRPLTGQGMSRFREVVEGLAMLGVKVDLVLASPLVRALQTAQILSAGLPGHPPIEETPALTPGSAS